MVVQNNKTRIDIDLNEIDTSNLSHYKLNKMESFNAVLVISEAFCMPDKRLAFLPVISVDITIDKKVL